jgi:hypothetical protein
MFPNDLCPNWIPANSIQSCPFMSSKIEWYIAPIINPKRLRYACNQNLTDSTYDDLLLHMLLSFDRFRMRTGLVTRMQLSRRSPDLHAGMPTSASIPCAGMS